MTKHHWRFALLGLAIASALTHLSGLSYPREVIFDEVHFGKFVTAYCCTHERFFDIHPPHAKLLIAGSAWLSGFRGGFPFERISQPYADQPVWALRLVPALTGVLLPVLVATLLRQLGVSKALSLLGGIAVWADNALTIQMRIIALDGVLLVATIGSLCAYVASQKATGSWRWTWLLLAGALAGLAAGTKFTGLAALGLLGVLTFIGLVKAIVQAVASRQNNASNERPAHGLPAVARPSASEGWLTWIAAGLVILAAAVAIYTAGWALHFVLTPLPGPGDAFHVPKLLESSGGLSITGFVKETITLHRTMLSANFNLAAGHPDSSPWWSWPYMRTPVYYWQGGDGSAFMYFIGNPIVWWGSSVLFLVALLASVISFGQRQRHLVPAQLWIPLLGFCIAMLPLVRVPRALFLYHYLTPLLFALVVGLMWLDQQLTAAQRSDARRWQVTAVVAVGIIAGFIWFSPLTYGLPLAESLHPWIFWTSTWR